MKSFLTFKSGKFYFCNEYDEQTILPLLVQASVLNETVSDLPILPELSSRMDPDIMYSSIAGTAAIEGNPITEEDVRKIAEGHDPEIYTQKDKMEIRNLIKAYDVISDPDLYSKGPNIILSEELIQTIHRVTTLDVPHENNIPGKYREGIVYVGDKAHGGIYTPPKIYDDIKSLMHELIGWINSPEVLNLDPFIRASLAHYHICLIHPFWDGNGRTARLIEALILQAGHVKYVPKELSNYYYRNVDNYYIAFSKSLKLKKNVTPFLEFTLIGAIESLKSIKGKIIFFIRKFSLRDFYLFRKKKKDITGRQYELMCLLLDHAMNLSFGAKDLFEVSPMSLLYRKVSVQTARRDLKRMQELGLLSVDKQGKYSINMLVLG